VNGFAEASSFRREDRRTQHIFSCNLTALHSSTILPPDTMKICALACALLSITSPLIAQDWPEFRGPDGQGHSTAKNLPIEWSSTKHVAWRTPLPGAGWSSPVLHAGHLYLTAAIPAGASGNQSLRALSLDAATGKIIWDQEVFAAPVSRSHSKNSQASPTPIVRAGRIYVHFGHQGTACLDLAGKVLWRNDSLKYSPVHGNGGSPLLVDDLLVFSCDGASAPFVVALNAATGNVRWKTPRETLASRKFSFSTPLLAIVGNQQQIISPGSGAVSSYGLDGRERWRVRYGEGYSVIPRPVFGHGLLFIATGYDRPTLMAVRPGGTGDVTASHVAWTLTKGAPNTPSPLLVGDELYLVADSGVASCVDAKIGTIHWQERVCSNTSASPIFADGKIYIQDEQGLGVVLKPGKTFAKLAANSIGERTLASYAATDGALFIRGDKHLYRIQSN
jgi:outer membrane protein assembly factor BamB